MRHWLCVAALCAIPASAAADAPMPQAASVAAAHRPARGSPKLALAATPTQETGGVSAPLPRGNPGDPLARQAREQADEEAGAGGEGARASDLEAKESAAAEPAARSSDTEGK